MSTPKKWLTRFASLRKRMFSLVVSGLLYPEAIRARVVIGAYVFYSVRLYTRNDLTIRVTDTNEVFNSGAIRARVSDGGIRA